MRESDIVTILLCSNCERERHRVEKIERERKGREEVKKAEIE